MSNERSARATLRLRYISLRNPWAVPRLRAKLTHMGVCLTFGDAERFSTSPYLASEPFFSFIASWYVPHASHRVSSDSASPNVRQIRCVLGFTSSYPFCLSPAESIFAPREVRESIYPARSGRIKNGPAEHQQASHLAGELVASWTTWRCHACRPLENLSLRRTPPPGWLSSDRPHVG